MDRAFDRIPCHRPDVMDESSSMGDNSVDGISIVAVDDVNRREDDAKTEAIRIEESAIAQDGRRFVDCTFPRDKSRLPIHAIFSAAVTVTAGERAIREKIICVRFAKSREKQPMSFGPLRLSLCCPLCDMFKYRSSLQILSARLALQTVRTSANSRWICTTLPDRTLDIGSDTQIADESRRPYGGAPLPTISPGISAVPSISPSTSPSSKNEVRLTVPEPPFEKFSTHWRVHWYPGHMERGLRQMRERILHNQVGLIVEIRDARVPLSCVNWKFESLSRVGVQEPSREDSEDIPVASNVRFQFRDSWGVKIGAPVDRIRKMILYNKCDLVDGFGGGVPSALDKKHTSSSKRPSMPGNEGERKRDPVKNLPLWRSLVMQAHQRHSPHPIRFSSLKETREQESVEALLLDAVREWVQMHRPAMKDTPSRPYPPLTILVTGLPNTGKSTLINALRIYGLGYQSGGSKQRGKQVASVGKNPGHTRAVSGRIKVVDTESGSMQHIYSVPSPALEQKNKLQSETTIAKMLRAMNVRLKVFVMDSPGILPPYISDKHAAVKLALAGSIPNDTSGDRGADTMLLCEYLWWRMRERWNIWQQVLQVYGYRDLSTAPDIHTLVRHIATVRKQERIANGSSSNSSEKSDMNNACEYFLSHWRTGNLYRQLGVFPSVVKSESGRISPSKQKMMKDLWRIAMLDDEFSFEGAVDQWFDGKFRKRPERPPVVVAACDDEETHIGDMNVSKEETINAKSRRKRQKQRD